MGGAVAVVASVFGAGAAVYGTVKADQARREATKAQQKQQRENTRRQQRQAVRQMMIARSAAINVAGQTGALEGSGLAGGLSSLYSQTGEAIGFSNIMSGLSNKITQATSQASFYSNLAGLGGGLFSAAGGFGTMFGTNSQAPSVPPLIKG